MHDASQVQEAENCSDMAEVRSGVDAVDREILALLAKRFGYMQAAARIKADRSAVRDDARKAQVIENAKSMAREMGIPEGAIAEIWETLVEASIAYELDAWEEIRR
jgi:isochorismate pyruvate lyase